MEIYRLIKPFGILTYALVLFAVISGLFLRKLGLRLQHHKIIALVALILATLHGILVLIVLLGT
jgi:hypothetical protein